MKIRRNRRKSQFHYLEKGGLELCRAATTKLRQIEWSGLFLIDHNGQTQVYRSVSGPPDVQLRRNRYSLTKGDDDCASPVLIMVNGYFSSFCSQEFVSMSAVIQGNLTLDLEFFIVADFFSAVHFCISSHSWILFCGWAWKYRVLYWNRLNSFWGSGF